MINSFAELNYN